MKSETLDFQIALLVGRRGTQKTCKDILLVPWSKQLCVEPNSLQPTQGIRSFCYKRRGRGERERQRRPTATMQNKIKTVLKTVRKEKRAITSIYIQNIKILKINSGICPSSWKGEIKTSVTVHLYAVSPCQGGVLQNWLHMYVCKIQAEIQTAHPAPVHFGGMKIPEVEAPSQLG